MIATGWTVRGSNSGGERDFPYPFRTALGPTQPPVHCVPALFPVGTVAYRGVVHIESSAEVKERVGPYLYSLCRPLWPVKGRTLPLLSLIKVYEKKGQRLFCILPTTISGVRGGTRLVSSFLQFLI